MYGPPADGNEVAPAGVEQAASGDLDISVAQLPYGLSAREGDVLRLLAAGLTNREIAERLVLSSRTVDHQVETIYRKIGARRRADATAYAHRIGLVAPDAPPQ